MSWCMEGGPPMIKSTLPGETWRAAARIVTSSFQGWMHFKNEKESCDIYIGMNTSPRATHARRTTCKPSAIYTSTSTTKAWQSLQRLRNRICCPDRTTAPTLHPRNSRWFGESRIFRRKRPRRCCEPWRADLGAIQRRPDEEFYAATTGSHAYHQ